jgi:hypothetical protein
VVDHSGPVHLSRHPRKDAGRAKEQPA